LIFRERVRAKWRQFAGRCCLGVFMVPLGQGTQWQSLEFSSLPKNKVTYQKDGLTLEVNKSSSPLIFPFKAAKAIQSITVKGRLLKGSLDLPAGKVQGAKGVDDFIVKVGLVKKGKKTLNWAQRQIAPKWITKLYSLAPKGSGVDSIQFLALGSQEKIKGRKRTHPLSDLLFENVVATYKPAAPFRLESKFAKPMETLALWISSDGDDTGSQFTVKITEIKIETL